MLYQLRNVFKHNSSIALIIANIIPLIGVLYFEWQLFILVLLYWLENVVLGFFGALKILSASPYAFSQKFSKASFFSFHYGFFCFIHGSILLSLFGDEDNTDLSFKILFSDNELFIAFIALIISHAFSFIDNFILREEYKQQSLTSLMKAPYKRIFILHVFIIVSAIILSKLGESTLGLVSLAIAKIIIDLFAHNAEHKTSSE